MIKIAKRNVHRKRHSRAVKSVARPDTGAHATPPKAKVKIKSHHILLGLLAVLVVAGLVFGIARLVNESGQGNLPNNKRIAAAGDTVELWYTGRFEDGTLFDTNVRAVALAAGKNISGKFETFTFKIGAGMVIPGFDKGVVGMRIGETKNISVSPEEGYGLYKAELVQSLPLSNFTQMFPSIKNITKGMKVTFNYRGQIGSFLISNTGRDFVTLDFNSPLAGKKLFFEATLINITSG